MALTFLSLLPAVGFSLGTLTLLGPVRWATTAIRAAGFTTTLETAAVLMLMVTLLAVSALLSLLLTYRLLESGRAGMVTIPTMVFSAAGLALWAWLTPSLINRGAGAEVLAGTPFTFGPYPTRATLERLSGEGYTHVVSLLHPAVAPFEPKLLADERRNVAEVGLGFVHAPMLPWVSSNEDALATISALAADTSGKYYVHCYLGRDRVGVVRRLIYSLWGITPTLDGDHHPLAQRDHLQRGPVIRASRDLFFTPYPSDEEMLAFFQNEATSQVVSLMDPTNPRNLRWIEGERRALAAAGVTLIEIPLSPTSSVEDFNDAAARIRGLEGVTIVHAFQGDSPALTRLLSTLPEPPDR